MGRLTDKDWKNPQSTMWVKVDLHIKNPYYNVAVSRGLQKLAEYEDLEEQGRMINEEDVLKFYYIDSEDKYVVGRRLDTMYYAEVTEGFSLAFYMSRYLPWGEHVVDENSAWKECTYCSEPREIPFTEWLKGFMEQRAKLKELENECRNEKTI